MMFDGPLKDQLFSLVALAEPFYRYAQATKSDHTTGLIVGRTGDGISADITMGNIRALAALLEDPSPEVVAIRVETGSAARELKHLVERYADAIKWLVSVQDGGTHSWYSNANKQVEWASEKAGAARKRLLSFLTYYGKCKGLKQQVEQAHNLLAKPETTFHLFIETEDAA